VTPVTEGLPLRWGRWPIAGVVAGSGLLLLAAFGFKHVPAYAPPPDFNDVRYTQGRLFCSSYTSRAGSGFRIDDTHYRGGACTLKRHGVHGARVQASWVAMPGPGADRLLLTLKDLQTGEVIFHASPGEWERRLRDDAEQDPYAMVKLCAAFVGVALVCASLARAHVRTSVPGDLA
jgi:hypothetical protein